MSDDDRSKDPVERLPDSQDRIADAMVAGLPAESRYPLPVTIEWLEGGYIVEQGRGYVGDRRRVCAELDEAIGTAKAWLVLRGPDEGPTQGKRVRPMRY